MKQLISGVVLVMFWMVLTGIGSAAERPQRVRNTAAPAAVSLPVSIVSIIPAQSEPGGRVTLYGSGFGERSTVFLGSVEVAVQITEEKQAEFTVPSQLEPGLYALYLKRADGTTGRSYNFTVLPLRPVLTALSPDHISHCAQGKEREVLAQGANFIPAALLLFDGAVIRSAYLSPESISFSVPHVAGGLHQIMVKNAPENGTVAVALTIETRPEITQVTIGNEQVNYYELIISGRNFTQNSSLYVDGQQIGGRGGQDLVEREKLVYVDCSKLIYRRHPYSPATKDFRLQILNPGGESSQMVTVTAP